MRYEVHGIGNAECTEICVDVLYASNDLKSIKQAMESRKLSNRIYGCAILDRVTGLIDYGYGFGVPVPDLEENL